MSDFKGVGIDIVARAARLMVRNKEEADPNRTANALIYEQQLREIDVRYVIAKLSISDDDSDARED